MSIWKWIKIPTGQTKHVEAAETYEVRWWAMGRVDNDGIASKRACVEVFPSRETADEFAKRLYEAAALLNDFHGSYGRGWGPFVSKNKYKGI